MSGGIRPNARKQGPRKPRTPRPDVKLPAPDENGRIPKPPQDVVDRLVEYEQKARGHDICGAWRPNHGWVCCKWPLRGRPRCEFHGGATPRGIESPHFRVGIFSESYTGSMGARYQRILADQKLLDLREHIAVSTDMAVGILTEMNAAVPSAEPGAACKRLGKQIVGGRDGPERATALVRLFELLDAGSDAVAKRAEFFRLQDHIRKLTDTERRHQEKERQMMSYEAFVVNMAILAEAMDLFFDRNDIRRFLAWVQTNVIGMPKGTDLATDTADATPKRLNA